MLNFKYCGEDFGDFVPSKFQKLAKKHNLIIPENKIFDEKHKAVRALFKEYFKLLCQHLEVEHSAIQKIEKQNKKTFQVTFFHFTF